MPPEDQTPRARRVTVELAVDDRRLARRLASSLRELPDLELVPPDAEGEIVLIDYVPGRPNEPDRAAVICLVDRDEAAAALRTGAAAVISRSAGTAELWLAIDAVRRGYLIAPAGTLDRRDDEEMVDTVDPDRGLSLTARERDVLALLAEGASNKQIARRLAISVHTVKFHVASILHKLDATGRTDAVAQAVRLGLLML